ncbi:hypothetical protein IR083_03970 [Dysgonomonas sp. GY75]|uniref:hypothetical protein n=1 Tax=Dysgonomonas sp. GY75 TaxID=2780419 RepID=UPI0018844A27|nr:hypothetical protein [Dysgonomonas sp. GY75]MBF0647970.1 hypothetical protein [Dysgonomonas sp. GY75]
MKKNLLLAILLILTIGISAQIPVRTIYKKGEVVLSVHSDGAACRFTLSSGKNKNTGSSGSIATLAESDAPGISAFLSGLRDFVTLKEDRPMAIRLNDSVRIEKRGFHTEYIRITVDGSSGHVRLSHKELDKLYKEFIAWCDKNDIDYYQYPAAGFARSDK